MKRQGVQWTNGDIKGNPGTICCSGHNVRPLVAVREQPAGLPPDNWHAQLSEDVNDHISEVIVHGVQQTIPVGSCEQAKGW